jgi:hypothetical protein
MRMCLAAALIAKCGGSIPSRVKKCKGSENLNEFTRQHVVQSLTAKSLTPIPPIAVQCHPNCRDLRLLLNLDISKNGATALFQDPGFPNI